MSSPSETSGRYSSETAEINAQTGNDSGVRGQLSSLAQAAKEQASAAVAPLKENARSVVEEQKQRGAGRIDTLAQAIHNAANELDEEIPQAASYVHSAAGQLERASGLLRDNSVEDLMKLATDFAQERPIVFIAGAVTAGFLLARLLRSSPETEFDRGAGTGQESENI
jgi:ElaB/YqjD/DUF883 family membrane-anchored ribosome-binding protein